MSKERGELCMEVLRTNSENEPLPFPRRNSPQTSFRLNCSYVTKYRAFSLTWLALCKSIGTKGSIYVRKDFNSHRIGLVHQHGRRFIVFGTPIWPPWRHMKTLYRHTEDLMQGLDLYIQSVFTFCFDCKTSVERECAKCDSCLCWYC